MVGPAMVMEFCKWLRGCSLGDVASILKIEHRKKFVKMYRSEEKSLCGAVVPWPIYWLLTRYSANHIFCNGIRPDPCAALGDLKSSIERIKWQKVRFDKAGSPSWVAVVPPSRPLPPPTAGFSKSNAEFGPQINTWANQLFVVCNRTPQEAAGVGKSLTKYSHEPFLVKLAFNIRRRLSLIATKIDKEPGFTLETVDEYRFALERIACAVAIEKPAS